MVFLFLIAPVTIVSAMTCIMPHEVQVASGAAVVFIRNHFVIIAII